ncbi:MBL fold metallo-hydrolase [Streptosporangium subroseum]|uniref:MBL fold metallo-hydrolase n=1 Tax=Streptosporangium subroseum TaxID=106412 RepID=UPI000B780B29|nr:MBL fold metallo-hydrolase [Streptosporangium subroseum]
MHHDDTTADLARQLDAASDEELLAILAEADAADEAMHASPPRLGSALPVAPGAVEITLLGGLGCRYGMLAGGAGGLLVRTAHTCVVIDPGPAALDWLVRLAQAGHFDFAALDAVLVSHFHPDHYVDVIPCLEGAISARTRPGRPLLAGNTTVMQRFAAFSPYHLRQVDAVTLTHPAGDGDGEPTTKIGDLVVHATPTLHVEEAGRNRTPIGFALDTPGGGIWHTSDTNLYDGLTDAVTAILPDVTLVIAHADATNVNAPPERAALCHLQTRDVLTITEALRPGHVLIQHYDAAYSSQRYRIAQATWLQRRLDAAALPTRILAGAGGLQLTLAEAALSHHTIPLA